MLLLILCIFFSFCVAVTLQNLIQLFDSRCILGAQVKFSEINPTPKPENVSDNLSLKSLFNESYADYLASNEAKSDFPSSQVEFLAQSKRFLTPYS